LKNSSNILIILSGYSDSGVGEQFLEAMLRGYEKDSIFRYSTVVSSPGSTDTNPYETTTQQVPYSKYPGLALLAFKKYKSSVLPLAMQSIKSIIKEKNIDVIWVFMNSWYTIQIGAALADEVDVPYVTHVWDTPEYLAKKSYLPYFAKQKLMKDFGKAMKHATRAVTVSSAMTKIYKENYGVASTPMVFCPPKSSWRSYQSKSTDKAIEIIFAGSLYAFAQWNAFLDAVEWNNQSANRKINVTCVGNVSRWAKKRKWVNYLPLQPIDKAATLVNNADIAYLPYWMNRKHAFFVKTAFPGKMSFYIASGTPVLFHGPQDSTPTEFINKHNVGKTCHTNDKEDIIAQIEEILHPEFRQDFKLNQENTLDQIFHPDRCVEIFQKTLAEVSATPPIPEGEHQRLIQG